MADHIEIMMPVSRHISTPDLTGIYGCFVKARIPVVSKEEAPIVVEWESGLHPIMEFRALEGRLLEQDQVANARLRVEDLIPKHSKNWLDVDIRSEDWNSRGLYPFPRAGRSIHRGQAQFVEDPSVDDRLQLLAEAAAAAKQQVEDCVIVGDEVWTPTAGPKLSMSIDPKAPLRNVGLSITPPASSPAAGSLGLRRYAGSFSAFDLAGVTTAIAQEFKKVDVGGGRLTVLSEDGWSRDEIVQQGDAWLMTDLMFTMKIHMNKIAKHLLTEEVVDAWLGLREVQGNEDVDLRLDACTRFVESLLVIPGLHEKFPPSEAYHFKAWSVVVHSMSARRAPHAPELQGFSI